MTRGHLGHRPVGTWRAGSPWPGGWRSPRRAPRTGSPVRRVDQAPTHSAGSTVCGCRVPPPCLSHEITCDIPALDREVLVLDDLVTAHAPAAPGAFWRLRWSEYGRRKDTTACTRAEAVAKAEAIAERLVAGTPTATLRARG